MVASVYILTNKGRNFFTSSPALAVGVFLMCANLLGVRGYLTPAGVRHDKQEEKKQRSSDMF